MVLDQAYLELGGEDFSPLVERHENLVVTRTFSKGFALGAARVGYGLAQPALAEALDALRPPGSISSWSAAVAEIACHEREEMEARCAAIVEERGWLAAGMRTAGVEVLAHAGNFVLARAPVPDVFTRLVERGCAVRSFAHEPLLADCFRVTVSHRAANARLLRALAELAGGEAPGAEDGVRGERVGEVRRATRETRIEVRVGLLGGGRARIATGLGFLDHMLTSLAFWSLTDIELRCHGDLWVDEHHTVEDCAIALGEAFDAALGDRAGVRRFGSARAPLDEALAEATVDLSGRGIAELDLAFAAPAIGAHADDARAALLRQLRAPRPPRPARRRARRGRPPRGRGRLQGRGAGAARGGRARPRARRHREHEGRAVIATFVDYGAGNLRSLRAAFERTGAEVAVSDRPEEVAEASFVVIPGVGQAAAAMEALRERDLVDAILRCRARRCAPVRRVRRHAAAVRAQRGGRDGRPRAAAGLRDPSRRRAPPAAHGLERRRADRRAPAHRRVSGALLLRAHLRGPGRRAALRAGVDAGRARRLREPRRRRPRGGRAVPPRALGRRRRGLPARGRANGRTMLRKRIIPCLDVSAGRVVKGVNFVNLRDCGDPVEAALRYAEQGADEIVWLNITATGEDPACSARAVERAAEQIDVPLTVGGGVSRVGPRCASCCSQAPTRSR